MKVDTPLILRFLPDTSSYEISPVTSRSPPTTKLPVTVVTPIAYMSPSGLNVIPLPTLIPDLAVISPTESTLVTSS